MDLLFESCFFRGASVWLLHVDEDILQDFLVEQGRILEQLQEQIIDLEIIQKHADLLNALFRGYHIPR